MLSLARTSHEIILVIVNPFTFLFTTTCKVVIIVGFIIIKLSRFIRSKIRVNFIIKTEFRMAV